MKFTCTFNLSQDARKWLEQWKAESFLTFSAIVELLILDKVPSNLKRNGLGFEFKSIPTTYDLAPDGTVEPDIPRRFRRFGTVNESRENNEKP